MDIAQLSVSMAAQQTAQSVGIAAAKMAMDASSEALDLIEQNTASLDPSLGNSVDIYA
ncbi:YjfB family protein [uncultured Selenomonas sp.]|uniref:YjfB family protein n=1 Tax=uncultured Selenomonas sp. TaxID=159275 RepID=UPI0028EC5D33|nr:YjfB family protein [uncultured Selenomonas sp.]